MSASKTPFLRRIRSFVRREGRMTDAQKQAMAERWPVYGIEFTHQVLDLSALFARDAECILEIGFGMGASLAEMAAARPEVNFLGIEVHRPGVGNLLKLIEQNHLNNIRIICDDAVEVLNDAIPAASLSGVNLFFPDPWPKKKHHKRRIVQPQFVEQVHRVLKPGGVFHMATDWQPYAEHMLDVMQAAEGFTNLSSTADYIERPGERPLTKFEQRGQRLGHGVWDLQFAATG